MTTADRLDAVKAAALALPKTGVGVAEVLRASGARGLPGLPDHCPLANYFRSISSRRYVVRVACGVISVDVPRSPHWLEIPIPPGAERFIRQFDAGKYADLRSKE